MAISNLLPGKIANDNRRSIKPLLSLNAKPANQNVQRVSSGMLSNDIVASMIDTLRGLNTELLRITDIAKTIINSFRNIIVSIKELNKNVTSRFRSLNSELNASKLEFVKTIFGIPKIEMPKMENGDPINVLAPDPADPKGEKPKTSLLDLLTSAAGGAALSQAIQKLFSSVDFMKLILPFIFNPITLGAVGLIMLAYFAGKARADNPEEWEEFKRKLRGAGARSEVITGPSQETEKFGPVRESGVIRPDEVLNRNNLTRDDVSSSKGNIITLKDGRWFDTTSKNDKLQPPELHPDYKEPGYSGSAANLLKQKMTPVEKSRQSRAAAQSNQSQGASPSGAIPAQPSMPPAPAAGSTQPSMPSTPAAGSTQAPTPMGATGSGSFGVGGIVGAATPSSPSVPPIASPPSGTPKLSVPSAPPPTPVMTRKQTGATVIKNNNVTGSSSVLGAETNNVAGQNLPMFARNASLQELFRRQQIQYQ